MCGIVGALSARPVDQGLVAEMRDRLVHRGPDHAGLWTSEDTRVCLGHRRLAIIDLSPEANQPFVSRDGRYAITYNGEIYNFQSLREELEALGAAFHTHSDTEVLIEAFRYWGDQCLQRLSGMFAFALWDSAERRLICGRDRAGEKPFYFTQVRDSFVFASELKSLVLWPGFRKEIHYPALIDFFSFGFIADPKSIWEGCEKLPPGHLMTVDLPLDGPPRVGRPSAYWDMQFDPDPSVRDWPERIRATLQAAAGEMNVADVKVGTFLSGGLDSSSVTAALTKAGCAVEAFTVGFEEADYDERTWAREVARLYGAAQTERVVVADDVAPVMKKILWHYDEPFNDYSYLPTYYVCREARQAITVALSGDGGDELFAGYTKYRRIRLREDLDRGLSRPLVRCLAEGGSALLPAGNGLRRKLLAYRGGVSAMMLDMLTTGLTWTSLRGVARGPLARAIKDYSPMDEVLSLLRKAPPDAVGTVNSMRYLDLKLTLAGDILVKIDRASMAHSLEVRPVYLNRGMLALAGRIPPGLLADRRQTKKLLKSALEPWLPQSILRRPKMGFAMPLGRWMDGGLADMFGSNEKASAVDDLLDVERFAEFSRADSPQVGNWAGAAHSLFFLRHWLATWA